MILYSCPSCGKLFAIENNINANVFKVSCPNVNCGKSYIVRGNRVIETANFSILDLLQEIDKGLIPDLANLDKEELNLLIKELSNKHEIGNMLVCELINSLLGDNNEMVVDESEFFVKIQEEKPFTLQSLFEKLDKRIDQEYCQQEEGSMPLKLAKQYILTLKKEKEYLMEEIEQMSEYIKKLELKIQKYE